MGRFEGECAGKFIIGAKRLFELTNKFAFIDSRDVRWEVPAKARVDGASIPQVFWSVIGGPFDGEYVAASVIHDWYCDKRSRSWQDTHRVFYDAMLVSNVPPTKAKIMFWAVWWKGPRWEERVSYNVNLDNDAHFYRINPSSIFRLEKQVINLASPGDKISGYDEQVLSVITKIIERDNPDREQIEMLAETENPIDLT